jgi:hypothetical protein
MCRFCFCPSSPIDPLEVCPKYRDGNISVSCRPGEFLAECITTNDPFEQASIYKEVLLGLGGSVPTDIVSLSSEPPNYVHEGIPEEYIAFNRSMDLLAKMNPTRLYTLQQLEVGYQRSARKQQIQQRNALQSLQTRQALEMDMLVANNATSDLQSLVSQHVAEIADLTDHFISETENLLSQQRKEYMDLVSEVVGGMTGASVPDGERKTTIWKRADLPDWIGMTVVAARPNIAFPGRPFRISHFRGDCLDSMFSPRSPPDQDEDPEEFRIDDSCESAILIGCTPAVSLTTNQSMAISKLLNAGVVDCRWPSMQEQLKKSGELPVGDFVVTRHSVLGHGVSWVFHLVCGSDVDEEHLTRLLAYSDSIGVERIFMPDILVDDLRAPVVGDGVRFVQSTVEMALRRMDNRLYTNGSSLREILILHA